MLHQRRMIAMGKLLVDASLVAAAFCVAFVIRFEGDIPAAFAQAMLLYLPVVLIAKLALLMGAGQFRSPWRYVSLRDSIGIFNMLAGVTLAMLLWVYLRRALPFVGAHAEVFVLPAGVLILDLALCCLGLLGVRAATRLICEKWEQRRLQPGSTQRIPTLLYGAGRAGALVAKEILSRPDSGIQLIGFLDDDEHLHGMRVEGLPVLGAASELHDIAKQYLVRQVIISIATAQEKSVPRIARLCEENGLSAKIIPSLHEILEGKLNVSKFREVSIEDLLRRSPIHLDNTEVEKIVRDRTVLVTGAGGSIGSELCRIIARLGPAKLVLVEQAENSLFHIHMALVNAHPDLLIVPCIADICDENRMDTVFADHRPSLVLHAAAHKHVPMMEWNPGEAIKNNVLGTRALAMLADAWQVERFVMISTDKAVNPTSVMGVSKRVAELLVQSFGQKSSTRFMIVRFGNVLGSAGSVIPIFQKQIQQGGPVTVTHPDMKRYFMTIPEACQLVLQAGSMGKGGELFILDMGEPVKIVDLARDLIRLSGLVPDKDIEIRFTGLRPGEKLFEELSLNDEDLLKTANPRIFIGKVKAPSLHWIGDKVDELGDLAIDGNFGRIFGKLKEIVPEFQTLVIRTEPVAKESFKTTTTHEHSAPACSS
jgi:FlaA1/EpsC-like NDP-sugar epimerase